MNRMANTVENGKIRLNWLKSHLLEDNSNAAVLIRANLQITIYQIIYQTFLHNTELIIVNKH